MNKYKIIWLILIIISFNLFAQNNNYKLSENNLVNTVTIPFECIRAKVVDLFIDPKIEGRIVAISTYYDVVVSMNNGSNWTYSALNTVVGSPFRCLSFTFNPNNSNEGYLAAETDLLKTTDRGVTWDSTKMFQGFSNINYVVWHPFDSNVVFMSNFRPMFYETHLFRSEDSGNSWAIVDTATEYERFVFNSHDPNIIYGIQMYSLIRKSTDGGKTWKTINNNLVSKFDEVRVLEISKKKPDILYCGQLYYEGYDYWPLSMTLNGGESWERIDSTLLEIDPHGSVMGILVDNNIDGRFYISYTGGLYLTEDNGKHFQKIYSGKTGKIWSDNKNPETIYFNSDQGLLRFVDTVTVGIDRIKNELPNNFVLEQNYPNPFNPSTTIKYSIPRSTEYYSVQQTTLKVYDVLGREIATLVNKVQQPGNYEVLFDASSVNRELASGTYFYRLSAGNYSKTMKMILLK